jgi:hypothetical protein
MNIQQHTTIAIIMGNPQPRPVGTDIDAELLVQLSGQGRPGGLPLFQLAARKLPQPALMDLRRALCDQDLTLPISQDADGDV